MADDDAKDRKVEDVQFGCYLRSGEAKRLATYAERLQINRPNLGILLIMRELKCSRLGGMPRREGPALSKKGAVRVTARANRPDVKELFAKRIARLGLGMDEAVAMLFRAELDEKWLAHSLAQTGNRS